MNNQNYINFEIQELIKVIESISQELCGMADGLFEKYYRKLDDNISIENVEKAYQKAEIANDALLFINYRDAGNHCTCHPDDIVGCRYCLLKGAFDKFINENIKILIDKFVKEFGYKDYRIWLEMRYPNIGIEDIDREELLIDLYYALDNPLMTREELECSCNGVTSLCGVCRADERIRWRNGE